MKPLLEYLPLQEGESFVVKDFDYGYYPTPWHFHPEYELVLVTESTGKRFIGDSIGDFKPGNLAFIGSNVPHLYRNDARYYHPKSKLRARSIVVHFLEASFGNDFLQIPETKKIKNLFQRAERGIDVVGRTNELISEKMRSLVDTDGFARWLKLLEILHILSESKELKYISTSGMQGKNEQEIDRMNKIFNFVIKNFKKEIRVSEMAEMIHLSENAFSRYFSQRTRKSFTAFVNEVRLHHASKLLIENRMSVAEICFDCGFNNISNFNRQFRNLYSVNPLNYKKQYLNKV